MNTKKRAVAISMIAALSIGTAIIPTDAIAQDNTSVSSSVTSNLDAKIVSIKKKGYDNGVKYIENSDHKNTLKDNNAENYIIQSHIILSLLSDKNAELDNEEYKSAIRDEMKKLPNINSPSSDSQEAQEAFQSFFDIAVILRDINQSSNISKENIEKYEKAVSNLDEYFIVEGGPSAEKTSDIQEPTLDENPSSTTATSTEKPNTENDKEEDPSQTSEKETTKQNNSSAVSSENKESDTDNIPSEEPRPTQSLDNRPMYKNTIDALDGYQIILKNVNPDTVPPKCINARLADIWDKEANISIDTPPRASQEESASSAPTTTKELENPTTTKELSAPTTTKQMSNNQADGLAAHPMALIITDEEVDKNILDLSKENNIEKFAGTTIKLGEKDLVVNASCINDFFGATEDEVDTDVSSEKDTELTSSRSDINNDTILDMEKAVDDNSYLDNMFNNDRENNEEGSFNDTNNADLIAEVDRSDNSSHSDDTFDNYSDYQESDYDYSQREQSTVQSNDTNKNNTVEKVNTPQVVKTQPGKYSPNGARIIDSSNPASASPAKKGYWNGSRYVSEEEFLKGGVSSSYSGFEKEGAKLASKKVGPAVNTGGEIKKNFFQKIFRI